MDHAGVPLNPNAKPPAPSEISHTELFQLLSQGQKPGKDFILVDLRQTDHTGGTIRGSINLPMQTLTPSLPSLYTLFERAGISKIIWYCGSSQHRGLEAATCMTEFIEKQGGKTMQSFRLVGGIKGWANSGPEYTGLMDAYEEHVWR